MHLYTSVVNMSNKLEPMYFWLIAVIIASSFAVLFYLQNLFFSNKRNGQKRKIPEAAGAWPIIGHLHLLSGTDQLPHKVLGCMADKYGPIFRMKFGVHQVVVVSDSVTAKECFTTNDLALANRPKMLAAEILGYNHVIFASSPYGPYWREIKKIASIEFLSTRKIEVHRHIREFEVKSAIREIHEYWIKNKTEDGEMKMEMKEWFGNLVMNTMMKTLFGNGCTSNVEGKIKAHKAKRRFFELFGVQVVADFLPSLRWLDIGGHEKAMKEVAREIDSLIEGLLAAHKRMRDSKLNKLGDEDNFMDVMLSIRENVNFAGYDVDTVIKSTCMTLLLAGIDTTAVTLTWTLSLLLNNYQALKKAQDELDTYVGKDRCIQECDIKNLVYLQAIVKEALRLYPAAPLMAPHESREDCTINGYDMPKGTRLLVNVWKIHRDPNIWSNPYEFKPERFLTTNKEVDVKGNHYELLPFGSGRRICPGISLGLQLVIFEIAALLHSFDIKRPSGKPIDMTESFGLTNLKASPLEVHLSPRLAPSLYE